MLRRDVLTNGIDVSQYQGLINWEVVKNHIDFAIIRCGYGQDTVSYTHLDVYKRQIYSHTGIDTTTWGIYIHINISTVIN